MSDSPARPRVPARSTEPVAANSLSARESGDDRPVQHGCRRAGRANRIGSCATTPPRRNVAPSHCPRARCPNNRAVHAQASRGSRAPLDRMRPVTERRSTTGVQRSVRWTPPGTRTVGSQHDEGQPGGIGACDACPADSRTARAIGSAVAAGNRSISPSRSTLPASASARCHRRSAEVGTARLDCSGRVRASASTSPSTSDSPVRSRWPR
jgi:hypothetical protein